VTNRLSSAQKGSQPSLMTASNLAAFVPRVMQYGPPISREDKAEVEAFLGREFASLDAADAALEEFILSAGPEQDARLLPLLYRRDQRQCKRALHPSGCSCDSRVEPARSVNKNVTVPDGNSLTTTPRLDRTRHVSKPGKPDHRHLPTRRP
jgi:hypothetical protein